MTCYGYVSYTFFNNDFRIVVKAMIFKKLS